MTDQPKPRIGLRFRSLTVIHNPESDLFEIESPEEPSGELQGVAASINAIWAQTIGRPNEGHPVVAFVRRHAQAMRIVPIVENVPEPDPDAVQ
jgi:hypothetical protein